jgi:hypothetical protein
VQTQPAPIIVTPGETFCLPDGTRVRLPTEAELESHRLVALRDWQAQLASLGGVAPKPVTRGDLTAVLRARGWDRVIREGETVFLHSDDRGAAKIFPMIKTRLATDRYAPDQRLNLRCFLSPPDYLAVATAISTPHPPPPLIHRITVERQGFVLTRANLASAVTEAEAKLAAADIAMHLDQAAGWAPSRPGSAGLLHLAALVLRGDRAQLDRYAALGGDAGFVPFITPDMLLRAAALARGR